jgi:hypothetical protein
MTMPDSVWICGLGLIWLGGLWALVYRWRRGIYIVRFGCGTRDDHPRIFWVWIIFQILVLAWFAFIFGLAPLLAGLL